MATPPTTPYIINPGFEEGDTSGWSLTPASTVTASVTSSPADVHSGSYALRFSTSSGSSVQSSGATNTKQLPVYPGQQVQASCYIKPAGSNDEVGGRVHISWYNSSGGEIGQHEGNQVAVHQGQSYRISTVVGAAPSGAAYCRIGGGAYLVRPNTSVCFDNFTTNYTYNRTASLSSPADGTEYEEGDSVRFSVNIGGTSPAVSSVTYRRGSTVIGTSTTSPYTIQRSDLPEGEHEITATVLFADQTEIETNTNTITISSEPPPPPDTREFRASNAYTYLIAENFSGLSASMPATARVQGVELIVDYGLEVLVRSSDYNIEDPEHSNPNVIFDITDGGSIGAVLLDVSGAPSIQGGEMSVPIPVSRNNFEITEEGLSGNKKWTVFTGESTASTTIGSDTELFSLTPMAAGEFITKAVGIKFTPNLLSKPAYADDGDAVIRFHIDRLRVRVYFDAGSVEYYFTDGDSVLKGNLTAYCVGGGNLETGDAYGELQLSPDLEIVEGEASSIGEGWTMHSSTPPTDSNRIGYISSDMRYNSLPTQQDITDNRSRYEFVSTNFYGDKNMNSFYGVHGLPRAFAYNKDFFYKICTQPDAGKDQPRHVANHHGHLALGYDDGRVDLSVVGEPYNFDGAMGASSWATADPVTGLLPLPGMILGIFGEKSVTGLSGTTVDNFATQVISPKMGAIEYTIADMGFPVYANHYGIYTLSQVQQYGDFMGTPLSQDISPWLRPRLVRSYTKDEEVVCAWPVRSKNQYRLAFGDGDILTMTINNGQQGAPTFSKQKYFKVPELEDEVECEVSYDMEAIVPIAVSSELSHTGEERIHLAPLADYAYSELYLFGNLPSGEVGDSVNYTYIALGGLGPYRFNIVSGSLPEGTTMDPATARITGEFTVPGSYSWRVQVEDRLGSVAWVDDTCEVVGNAIACGAVNEHPGGQEFPYETWITLGSSLGWVELEFATGRVPDKFEVWLGGQKVLDTGYYGEPSFQSALDAALTGMGLPTETITPRKGGGSPETDWNNPATRDRASFYKNTTSAVATVRVFAPLEDTRWVFAINCPDDTEPPPEGP